MTNPSEVPAFDRSLSGLATLVAGGTGNVGRYIVSALLDRGATVVVPSRSRDKLEALRAAAGAQGRLVTLVGDVGDERDAERIRDEAVRQVASPLDAVVASLGRWNGAPTLLGATRAELMGALENYVVAHFVVARTFLPAVAARGGSYTFINGPSSFSTWPGSGLVSVATAAQSMLARVIGEETGATDGARITELIIHPSAWIGPEGTTNGGPIDGDAVGRYVAAIVGGGVTGETTLHLESSEQLAGLP
jgi:NAD(P)-dependent dehydrogenase (short-subunit alcohol dehydrogenase family)